MGEKRRKEDYGEPFRSSTREAFKWLADGGATADTGPSSSTTEELTKGYNYLTDAPKTYYTECGTSTDKTLRANVMLTAPTGHHFWGRNTQFSAPLGCSSMPFAHRDDGFTETVNKVENRR